VVPSVGCVSSVSRILLVVVVVSRRIVGECRSSRQEQSRGERYSRVTSREEKERDRETEQFEKVE